MIHYKNNLELTDSDLLNYHKWISPITYNEPHLLPRTVEDLANARFSVYAFDDEKIIGCGFFYEPLNNNEHITWKGMRLAELGTLYFVKGYRSFENIQSVINIRLDYAEKNNYFPLTITKHPNMQHVMLGTAVKVEDLNGEFHKLRYLIRDCHCDSSEKRSVCQKCPYDERNLWVYLRFILQGKFLPNS